jgi:hypothetical protein
MKNLVGAGIKKLLRMLAGAAMHNRPLAAWPRWAGDASEIKVPANVADRATLVQGYYANTLQRLSDRQFPFVHLDCDLYSSYKGCLDFSIPG